MAPSQSIEEEDPVAPVLMRQKTENDGDRDGQRIRKVVSYAGSDCISPMMLGKSKEIDDFNLERSPRQHKAKLPKRLSGRLGDMSLPPPAVEENEDETPSHHHHHHRFGSMLGEISAWIHEEKARRTASKAKRKEKAQQRVQEANHRAEPETRGIADEQRRDSDSSESSSALALEKLESILGKSPGSGSLAKAMSRKGSGSNRRRSSMRKLRRQSTASSDTEYYEGDAIVPSCDAVLDNSKTMSYVGGSSTSHSEIPDVNAAKDKEAWLAFKFEIVRLAHTLKLKGWRQVSMERCGDIDVERLSGALTNAVYVVAPPSDLPDPPEETNGTLQPQRPRRKPPKLLLRIYGPQVEHLIDRESELQILRRLARQKIGPRLLGTFTNGRFEEYFHARTLKPQDLRDPDTARQIAKRMRELHDGIELLIDERNGGPFVWKNWDKWVERCEKIVSFADQRALSKTQNNTSTNKRGDYICGAQWQIFRRTVEKYRAWLDEQYGGPDSLREHLVFAHNDTQYGNILRLEPPGESPLLLPANKHKQLVVIDFEYANANMVGLELANHFTEWCYNYHDPTHSYACNANYYPSIEEQQHFIRAYVGHRPQVSRANSTFPKPVPRDYPSISSNLVSSPLPIPSSSVPDRGLSSSLSSLSLHARTPYARSYSRDNNDNPYFPPSLSRAESTTTLYGDEESPEIVAEIGRLMLETRLWRTANSAQWVAWGIVQASVPGFAEYERQLEAASINGATHETNGAEPPSAPLQHHEHHPLHANQGTDPLDAEAEANVLDMEDRRPEEDEEDGDGAEDEEFDYLRYARERAMFFWGDCLQLGFVSEEELGEWGSLEAVKVVGY